MSFIQFQGHKATFKLMIYFAAATANQWEVIIIRTLCLQTYRCPKCGGSLVEEQAHVGCSRCGYHGNTLPYKERASVGKDLFIQGLERLEAHNITGMGHVDATSFSL